MAEEDVIEIDLVQLKKMKVQELRKQAADLGLASKGTKAELLARVEKYLKEQEEDLLEEEELEEGPEEGEEVGEEEEEAVGDGETPAEQQKPTTEVAPETTPLPQKATPTEQPAVPAPADAAVQKKTVQLGGGGLAPEQRMAKRAERFGQNSSENAKKLARAQRFGSSLENGSLGKGARAPPTKEELERMQKRAARFGTNVAPALTAVEESEKKMKRRDRFGLTTTDLPAEDRKRARLERFGAT